MLSLGWHLDINLVSGVPFLPDSKSSPNNHLLGYWLTSTQYHHHLTPQQLLRWTGASPAWLCLRPLFNQFLEQTPWAQTPHGATHHVTHTIHIATLPGTDAGPKWHTRTFSVSRSGLVFYPFLDKSGTSPVFKNFLFGKKPNQIGKNWSASVWS